jgi:hypothetical protein
LSFSACEMRWPPLAEWTNTHLWVKRNITKYTCRAGSRSCSQNRTDNDSHDRHSRQ